MWTVFFFLSASFCFSHLFGSISSLEIRSATRLWQTWPGAETDLPLCPDVVQCCSTDCWMCHCHPGECLRDDISPQTDTVLFSKVVFVWFSRCRCCQGIFSHYGDGGNFLMGRDATVHFDGQSKWGRRGWVICDTKPGILHPGIRVRVLQATKVTQKMQVA